MLKEKSPERCIEVTWHTETKGKYPVDIAIYGHNRDGLLRDITATVSNEDLGISGLNTSADKRGNHVTVVVTVDVKSREQAEKLQDILLNVSGVMQVSRR